MGKTKKKDHRSASLTRRQSTREVKQSFLIVCEGVRTEPDYFKAFRMTAATVKAVGQAMNTTSLVSKAILQSLQRGVAQEQLCRHAVKAFRNTLFQDGRIRGYYV